MKKSVWLVPVLNITQPQEKWEELVVELCQRLTSEEGDDEEKKEKVKETIGEGRERQTLLHFGASLGLCRLVFLSKP